MVCKIFFCFQFPNILDKVCGDKKEKNTDNCKAFALYENAERRRRKTAQATAKGYEFQAKAKTLI